MNEQTIQVEGLEKAMGKILEEYGDEVGTALSETCDEITLKARKVVRDSAPVDTGKYKKQINWKKERKNRGEVHNFIYVNSPDYRRAHLLENGHATSGGTGRVAGIPHFSKGEDFVKKHFEDELKRKVEDI